LPVLFVFSFRCPAEAFFSVMPILALGHDTIHLNQKVRPLACLPDSGNPLTRKAFATLIRQSGGSMFLFCSTYLRGSEMRTRGDLLLFAIAFALRGARKLARGLRQGLSEEERYRVADDVVHRLQQNGDQWRLSEDLPPPGNGHSTPTCKFS